MMSGSSDCQPKRRIIEFNSFLSSATEFGRSTQDVTRRFDEAERERDELRAALVKAEESRDGAWAQQEAVERYASELQLSTAVMTERIEAVERECEELRVEVRLLEQRLQDEQEDGRRMSAALRRIAGLGSRCTSDSLEHPGEDCAQCIAEEVLG